MNEPNDPNVHYDDDFHFDDFDTPRDNKINTESLFDGSKNKINWETSGTGSRKIVILGIVIAVIVFFLVYHFLVGMNNPLSSLHRTSVPKVPVVVVPPQTQNTLATADANMIAQKASSVVTDKINDLNETIIQQQSTITQLQSNMGALQDSINTLNNTVTTMSQQLSSIQDKLTKPVVKKEAKMTRPEPAPINYVIKAMVPGRAWLQSSDGSSLSVAVGNEVPGHGSVSNIDLSTGQVSMSDGSAFTYDINGN